MKWLDRLTFGLPASTVSRHEERCSRWRNTLPSPCSRDRAPMLRLLISRLTLAVPVLILVSMVAFVLLRLAPGDPAQLQAGPDAAPEVVQAIRRELALDQPLPVQYV